MHLNRLLPLIIPFLFLILFEVFFFNPTMIYVIAVLINLLLLFTVWQFVHKNQIQKDWWNFLILPSLLTTAILACMTIISNDLVKQFLILSNIIIIYFYLKYIYYYLVKPQSYEPFTIENISSYTNFLTFFLLAITIYGMQSFLNVRTWILMLIMLIFTSLLIYQIMWANKIEFNRSIIFILISSLIIFEISWSISFLPLNHNISGLTITICYYMLIGLVKHYLLDKLDKKIVKLYLSFGFLSLIVILATARWL